jgi:hypothetical protein
MAPQDEHRYEQANRESPRSGFLRSVNQGENFGDTAFFDGSLAWGAQGESLVKYWRPNGADHQWKEDPSFPHVHPIPRLGVVEKAVLAYGLDSSFSK